MANNKLSSVTGIGKNDIILEDIKIMWQLQIWSPERLNMVIKKKQQCVTLFRRAFLIKDQQGSVKCAVSLTN